MEISLMEILESREHRAMMQKNILKKNPSPLICFTMNIAGPVKTSPKIVRAFDYGLGQLEKQLFKYEIHTKNVEYDKSGPTAYISVSAPANDLKKICTDIEESCPLGRLFDMDVLDQSGTKLARESERSCIVCKKKGRSCAAGRLHPLEEILRITDELITNHFIESDSEYISNIAKTSLLKEVLTTPKPGLVDQKNNGSHKDMSVDLFIKSAKALKPYFKACTKIGIETQVKSSEETFNLLRNLGLNAEQDMYRSTSGINTHKGIIYSLGIICGAIGRLWTVEEPIAETKDILNMCKKIVKGSTEQDFANISPVTAGAKAYLNYGWRGIRGEVEDGFPSIFNVSLPILKNSIGDNKPIFEKNSVDMENDEKDRLRNILSDKENDAGVLALLHLMANIMDTCVYNRGGKEGVLYVQKAAKDLLQNNQITKCMVEEIDLCFIKKNLSPGGAADLLAITYFLNDINSILKNK